MNRIRNLSALHLRHDGPIPDRAAVPRDYDLGWSHQIRNRRRQAWQTVRHAGRQTIDARRHFRRAPSVESYRVWKLKRRSLAYALTGWAAFRDLAKSSPPETS